MLIRILFRNAFRHKLRTLLTISGMAVTILPFCLLQTVIDAWYAGVAASSSSRLVSHNAISLVFSLPLFYRERIRQVDGVTSTTNFQTFLELAFSFVLTTRIVIQALAFALIMGLLGGILPAIRAAQMNLVEALREA